MFNFLKHHLPTQTYPESHTQKLEYEVYPLYAPPNKSFLLFGEINCWVKQFVKSFVFGITEKCIGFCVTSFFIWILLVQACLALILKLVIFYLKVVATLKIVICFYLQTKKISHFSQKSLFSNTKCIPLLKHP